jgi:hypothetical protein
VNGTPVKFKLQTKPSSSIVIGAIAGPKAEISVRYCTGKASCTDSCLIPKDEFMAALGGGSDDDEGSLSENKKTGRNTASGGWNSDSPSKDESHLENELEKLDEETKGDRQKMNIFKQWVPSTATESCQGKLKIGR